MNDYINNDFKPENNFGGENFNRGSNEPITYNSYYNHKPRKKPWAAIIIIIVVLILVAISLWYAGAFTPLDRQAEYNKLYVRACTAAINYANKKDSAAKDISGKIVYVSVGNLIDANMIEANLRNYLTNELIPASTDIRLEVLPSGEFQCHGFVWPGTDTVKPIITLKGDAIIYGSLGVSIKDPGITAMDDQDGDISDKIQRSGNVNINQAGSYKVNYVVSDRAGNLSNTVQRTFVIQ